HSGASDRGASSTAHRNLMELPAKPVKSARRRSRRNKRGMKTVSNLPDLLTGSGGFCSRRHTASSSSWPMSRLRASSWRGDSNSRALPKEIEVDLAWKEHRQCAYDN